MKEQPPAIGHKQATLRTPLVLPVIHPNGNDLETLRSQYANADNHLADARAAFNKIEFHPRDYYPLGQDAIAVSSAGRAAIHAAFDMIEAHLEEHTLALTLPEQPRTIKELRVGYALPEDEPATI